MLVESDQIQAQVWFGVLFRPRQTATPENPALPEWAETLLDEGDDARGEESKLITRIAIRSGTVPLMWIRYLTGGITAYGLAISRSVNTAAEDGAGVICAYVPEDVSDTWGQAIAAVLMMFGTGSGVAIDWYQTLTLAPARDE
jgi:hypothetical protein